MTTMKNLEPYYKKNLIFLFLLAQYRPEPNWNFVIKAIYYLWRLFIYICLIGTLLFTFLDIFINGFIQISDVAMHVIDLALYSSIILRSFYFMYKHETIEYMINRMNMVMKESASFAFENYTMKKGRRLSDMMLIGWQVFVFVCGILFSVSVVFKSTRDLPLPMLLFYDLTNDLYFYIMLILQTCSQIFMVCSFGNVDMFNFSFHILMQHQFELLGEDFKYLIPHALHQGGMSRREVEEYMENLENENLIKIVDTVTQSKEFKNGCVDNLKVCIGHHQSLLIYRDEFYEFMSPVLVVELNFIFAYLIFALFTVVTTDNSAMLIALAIYVFAILVQVFTITFFGELLTNQVEKLRTIFYDMPWYICDKKFLMDYKFVQMRLTRNNYLKAGKLLAISLETFLEFVKKASSFFAVLRQVNE